MSLKSLLLSSVPNEQKIYEILFDVSLNEFRKRYVILNQDIFDKTRLYDPVFKKYLLEITSYEADLEKNRKILSLKDEIDQKTFINTKKVISIKPYINDKDHVVISREEDHEIDINYYIFYPVQFEGIIYIETYNPIAKTTQHVPMNVHRRDPITIENEEGTKNISYIYEITYADNVTEFDFLTKSHVIIFVQKIIKTLGLDFLLDNISRYISLSEGRRILVIDTKPEMLTLINDYNRVFNDTYLEKYKRDNTLPKQLPIDKLGYCYESEEGLILVPETFKLFDSQSFDVFSTKRIEFIHSSENLAILENICGKSGGFLRITKEGNKIVIISEALNILDRNFISTPKIIINGNDERDIAKLSSFIPQGKLEPNGTKQGISKQMFVNHNFGNYDVHSESGFFNLNRSIYTNLLELTHGTNELSLSQNDTFMKFIGPNGTITFNRAGYRKLDKDKNKNENIQKITDRCITLNTLNTYLLPFFLVNQTMTVNGKRNVADFLNGNYYDDQILNMIIPINYGFYNGITKWYRSVTKFTKVNTYRALRFSNSGNSNVITFIVNHDPDQELILDSKSDLPLCKPINLDQTKTLFMMRTLKSTLLFTKSFVYYPVVELDSRFHDRNEMTILLVNIEKQQGPLFSPSTMLRFYLETLDLSLNLTNLEPYSFVRDLLPFFYQTNKVIGIAEMCILCSSPSTYSNEISSKTIEYICNFFEHINNMILKEFFNVNMLLNSAVKLPNEYYWIFQLFNLMIKSVSEPIGTHELIIFNEEIYRLTIKKQNEYIDNLISEILAKETISLSEFGNKIVSEIPSHVQIDSQSIRSTPIFQRYIENLVFPIEIFELPVASVILDSLSYNNIFPFLVLSIREYINKDLSNNQIISKLIEEDIPRGAFQLEDKDDNKFIIVEYPYVEKLLSFEFVLESRKRLTFSENLIIDKIITDYTPNSFLDAVFMISFKIKESNGDDSEKINEFIKDNLKRLTLFKVVNIDNNSFKISRILDENDTRHIFFCLSFEDNGILICKSKKCITDSYRVRLLTESCIVSSKEDFIASDLIPKGYIDTESTMFKFTMASGIQNIRLSPLIFSGYKSFLLHVSSLSEKEFSLTFDAEYYLIPSHAFSLYSELLVENRIHDNLLLCKTNISEDFDYNLTLSDFIKLYHQIDKDIPTNDLLLITSDSGVSTKDFGAFNPTIYSQNELILNTETVEVYEKSNNTLTDFFNEKIDEVLSDHILGKNVMSSKSNISFTSSILPHNIETIGITSFTSNGFIRTFTLSKNNNILAVLTTNHVQIYYMMSGIFKHISTLMHDSVYKIIISETYAITISHDENKLWFIPTGLEINIKFENYIFKIGDIVEADEITGTRITHLTDVKINNITKENGRLVYKNGGNILENIKSKIDTKIFIFSDDENYLTHNSNNGIKILDLITMKYVTFLTYNGASIKDFIGNFIGGQWNNSSIVKESKEVVGKNIFFAQMNISHKLLIMNPYLQSITETTSNVAQLPQNIMLSNLINESKISKLPNEIIEAKNVFDNSNGMWFYDVFIDFEEDKIIVYDKGYSYVTPVISIFNDTDETEFYIADGKLLLTNIENVKDYFIQHINVILDNGKPIVTDIYIDGYNLFSNQISHKKELPIIVLNSGKKIFVTSGKDEIITVSYDGSQTNITRFDIRGDIKYKVDGIVSILLDPIDNYNILVIKTDEEGNIEFQELKRSNELFSYQVSTKIDSLYKISNKKESIDTKINFAILNNIRNVKCNKTTEIKSIDMHPISSFLCLNRPNEFELRSIDIKEQDNDSYRIFGNLVLSIKDNTLKILPHIVQFPSDKVEENQCINAQIKLKYETSSKKEFEEFYNEINEIYTYLIEKLPELLCESKEESKVFQLISRGGKFKGEDFKRWISFRISDDSSLGLMSSTDPRLKIIKNPAYEGIMKRFFSVENITDIFMDYYASGDFDSIEAIKAIVPELTLPTFAFYEFFSKLIKAATSSFSEESKDSTKAIKIMRSKLPKNDNLINCLFKIADKLYDGKTYGRFNVTTFFKYNTFKINLFNYFERMVMSCRTLLDKESSFDRNRNKNFKSMVNELQDNYCKLLAMSPDIFLDIRSGEPMMKFSMKTKPEYQFRSYVPEIVEDSLNDLRERLDGKLSNNNIEKILSLRRKILSDENKICSTSSLIGKKENEILLLKEKMIEFKYLMDKELKQLSDKGIDSLGFSDLVDMIKNGEDISDYIEDINTEVSDECIIIRDIILSYLNIQNEINLITIDINDISLKIKEYFNKHISDDKRNFNDVIASMCTIKKGEDIEDILNRLNVFFSHNHENINDIPMVTYGVNLKLLIKDKGLLDKSIFSKNLTNFNVPVNIEHVTREGISIVHRDRYRVLYGKMKLEELKNIIVDELKEKKYKIDNAFVFFKRIARLRLDDITSFTKISDDQMNLEQEFDDKGRMIKNDSLTSKINKARKSDDITQLLYVREFLEDAVDYYRNEIEQEVLFNFITLINKIEGRKIINTHLRNQVDIFNELLNIVSKVISLSFNDPLSVIKTKIELDVGLKLLENNNQINKFFESSKYIGTTTSLFEYEKIIIENTCDEMFHKSDEKYDLLSNLKNFSYLGSNEHKKLIEVREEYPEYNSLCLTKEYLQKKLQINFDIYLTPLSFYIKQIVSFKEIDPDVLDWFVLYGYDETINYSYPESYKEYHYISVTKHCSILDEKIRTGQFVQSKDEKSFKQMEKFLRPYMNKYRNGSYEVNSTLMNELIFVFENPIFFTDLENSSDEFSRIYLEFQSISKETIDITERFSIDLFEIISSFKTTTEDRIEEFILTSNVLENINSSVSEAKKKFVTLVPENFKRLLSVYRSSFEERKNIEDRISSVIFKIENVFVRRDVIEYSIGLEFSKIISMDVSIHHTNMVDKINIKKSNNDFGYSNLIPVSNIYSVKNKSGSIATILYNQETYMVKIFNYENENSEILGGICFYKLSDGNRIIFKYKNPFIFDNLYIEDNELFYGLDTEKITDLKIKLDKIIEIDENNFKQKQTLSLISTIANGFGELISNKAVIPDEILEILSTQFISTIPTMTYSTFKSFYGANLKFLLEKLISSKSTIAINSINLIGNEITSKKVKELDGNSYKDAKFDKSFIKKNENFSLFVTSFQTTIADTIDQSVSFKKEIVGSTRKGKAIEIIKIDNSTIKTNEHSGSCVKIFKDERCIANLVFPYLIIKDISIFAPSNNEDGILTIIGVSSGKKIRIGTIRLNSKIFSKQNATSVIIRSFDTEGILNLPAINNPVFKLSSNTMEFAIVSGKNSDETIISCLLIWGNKYVTTRIFKSRINDISVSRYGNYVSVIFDDESVVFDRAGNRIGSFLKTAKWI